MKRCATMLLLLLLFGSAATAQELELEGPGSGYIREPLKLSVKGLPAIDLAKPLNENMAWRDSFAFKVDAPKGCKVQVDPELVVDFLATAWKLRVVVTCDQPATVFVVAVDHNAKAIALHRVTFKRRGPPPAPKINLVATVNGKPGNTAPGHTIKVGEPVIYGYQVRNTGNVPLSPVEMIDTCGAAMEGPSGDNGNDGILGVGEVWKWQTRILAAEGEQKCSAIVVATHGEAGEIEANATVFYEGRDRPAPGKRFVVIVYEAQQQTAKLADLLADIRADIDSQAKHQLVIEDKDARTASGNTPPWLKPYFDKIAGQPLPQVFIVTEGGEVLHQDKLADNLADFKATLTEHGG